MFILHFTFIEYFVESRRETTTLSAIVSDVAKGKFILFAIAVVFLSFSLSLLLYLLVGFLCTLSG